MDRFALQTAEFDAMAHLAEQYRRLTYTPIVDDDYALRAFASEVANRTWRDAPSMARDFPTASFDALPSVTFHLAPCSIVIDCVIDFPTATVLVDSCRPKACNGVAHCTPAKETAE